MCFLYIYIVFGDSPESLFILASALLQSCYRVAIELLNLARQRQGSSKAEARQQQGRGKAVARNKVTERG